MHFPVQLAFATTVNKSQGQTFGKIGLYTDKNRPICGLGHLFVTVSRCFSKHGLKVEMVGAKYDSEKVLVQNVAFKSIIISLLLKIL